MHDDEVPEFVVNLNLKFSAIRLFGDKLLPTRFSIKADMFQISDSEQNEVEFKATISTVKFFIENVMNNALFVSVHNEWAHGQTAFMKECKNTIVLLPEEPTDYHLAEILHSKFNALGGELFQFSSIEIAALESEDLNVVFFGSGIDNLPEMKDWWDGATPHEEPWWARQDLTTMEFLVEGFDEDKFKTLYDVGFIRKQFETPVEKSAQIIQHSFAPKIVEKTDD